MIEQLIEIIEMTINLNFRAAPWSLKWSYDVAKKNIIWCYSMVCLNTRFWLAGRCWLNLFNAQVVPGQFNHRSILMHCFNWCTLTNTHHSLTHTHTRGQRERERSEIADCAAHTHKLVVNDSQRFLLLK